MAARINPADYLYLSARVRAMENTLVGREKLNGLMAMPSVGEIVTALAPFGFEAVTRNGAADTEAMLCGALARGYRVIFETNPVAGVFDFLRYPYDCNNIKALLKCDLRGISPKGMLTDLGTVPEDAVREQAAKGENSRYPAHMAAAVSAASAAYAETKNPQVIDLILDRACFADMAAGTEHFPFARGIVAIRADLVNLMTCVRLIRMGATFPMRAAMLQALVPGGTLPEAFFTEGFDGGESRLIQLTEKTPYAPLFGGGQALTLAAIEKNADDIYMQKIRTAKQVTFGAEVPLAYLAALEMSVKNLRILLAGKAAGLDSETIGGRMRCSYV